ncbi:hypothetical protein GALMADRAFT_220302 [Galerina marginata CBS 339.88]|uniref:Uncharacterized protein n=1 Tax=Galerina marginata (strain CBS 339.88) TaxID=685588 RepID=A0A067TNA4_GALM3|nr:hypothetical protein GALMADRAFT_220302 [Galerina marginata CBS 339.88]
MKTIRRLNISGRNNHPSSPNLVVYTKQTGFASSRRLSRRDRAKLIRSQSIKEGKIKLRTRHSPRTTGRCLAEDGQYGFRAGTSAAADLPCLENMDDRESTRWTAHSYHQMFGARHSEFNLLKLGSSAKLREVDDLETEKGYTNKQNVGR